MDVPSPPSTRILTTTFPRGSWCQPSPMRILPITRCCSWILQPPAHEYPALHVPTGILLASCRRESCDPPAHEYPALHLLTSILPFTYPRVSCPPPTHGYPSLHLPTGILPSTYPRVSFPPLTHGYPSYPIMASSSAGWHLPMCQAGFESSQHYWVLIKRTLRWTLRLNLLIRCVLMPSQFYMKNILN